MADVVVVWLPYDRTERKLFRPRQCVSLINQSVGTVCKRTKNSMLTVRIWSLIGYDLRLHPGKFSYLAITRHLDCGKTVDVTYFKGSDLRPATGIVLSSNGKHTVTILDLDDLSGHRRHVGQARNKSAGHWGLSMTNESKLKRPVRNPTSFFISRSTFSGSNVSLLWTVAASIHGQAITTRFRLYLWLAD
ncbi:hypothetical protein CLF_106228 [Clonorchis sinensis]|uniref:Uncharacterized protein n=1 Tax=Clonorchis sinensis TaxID=79923 RepID=G7YEU2_CLOSI|nr:hypothetical protein CLF_106228 [Clonorchis sinensis]